MQRPPSTKLKIELVNELINYAERDLNKPSLNTQRLIIPVRALLIKTGITDLTELNANLAEISRASSGKVNIINIEDSQTGFAVIETNKQILYQIKKEYDEDTSTKTNNTALIYFNMNEDGFLYIDGSNQTSLEVGSHQMVKLLLALKRKTYIAKEELAKLCGYNSVRSLQFAISKIRSQTKRKFSLIYLLIENKPSKGYRLNEHYHIRKTND